MKINDFEHYKDTYLNKIKDSKVKEAMIYVLKGGQRIRSRLLLSILDGFDVPQKKGYDAALALEMIHAYSLVHDDLPCMDDDDLRRGQPSCHIAFGEDVAVLCGDALLTEAFRVLASSKDLNSTQKVDIIKAYSELAGCEGMIYGQILDLENENNTHPTLRLLNEIDYYKTSCLFMAALYAGMYIVGDQKNQNFYKTLAEELGITFQMQDDLFDVIKTTQEMGKPSKSDLQEGKMTALSVFGSTKELNDELNRRFAFIIDIIKDQDFDQSSLLDIVYTLKMR